MIFLTKFSKYFIFIGLLTSLESFGKWSTLVEYLCLSNGSDYGYCEYSVNSKSKAEPGKISINAVIPSKLNVEKCQFRLKDKQINAIYYPNQVQLFNNMFSIYFNDTTMLTKNGVISTETKTTNLILDGTQKSFKVIRSWISNQENASQPPTNSGEIKTHNLPDRPFVLQYEC